MKPLNSKHIMPCKTDSSVKNTIAFVNVVASPMAPQFAALYYFMETCPRILTLSWYFELTGEKTETVYFRIKPDGFEITDAMTKVHGYTADFAVKHGRPVMSALKKMVADFDHYNPQQMLIQGSKFNLNVLATEFSRAGIFPSWLPIPKSPFRNAY